MANIIISKNPSLKLLPLYPMNCARKADWQLKTYNEHYKKWYAHLKADKANMQAATTKLAYFINNVCKRC